MCLLLSWLHLLPLLSLSLSFSPSLSFSLSLSLCLSLSLKVCYLEFDRKDIPMNKLVVTSLESKFNVFDLRTHHPSEGFACLTEKVNF